LVRELIAAIVVAATELRVAIGVLDGNLTAEQVAWLRDMGATVVQPSAFDAVARAVSKRRSSRPFWASC
jgi:hypothetical protein